MKLVIYAIFILLVAVGAGILNSFILLDIAHKTALPILSDMNIRQMYGLVLIITLLRYKRKKEDKEHRQPIEEVIDKISEDVLEAIIMSLIVWGLFYTALFLLNSIS